MKEKNRIRLNGFGWIIFGIGLALLAWFALGQFEGGIIPILRPFGILVGIACGIVGGVQVIIGRNIGGD